MGRDIGKPDFSDVRYCVASSACAVSASVDVGGLQSQVGAMVDEAIQSLVATGDSRSRVAGHFHGHANAWTSIFDASRGRPRSRIGSSPVRYRGSRPSPEAGDVP